MQNIASYQLLSRKLTPSQPKPAQHVKRAHTDNLEQQSVLAQGHSLILTIAFCGHQITVFPVRPTQNFGSVLPLLYFIVVPLNLIEPWLFTAAEKWIQCSAISLPHAPAHQQGNPIHPLSLIHIELSGDLTQNTLCFFAFFFFFKKSFKAFPAWSHKHVSLHDLIPFH